jgi:hypothetical protein
MSTSSSKLRAFELTPSVATVIGTVLAETIRLAGTTAVNWVALTNVVARLVPLHRTVVPEENPVPVTVSVNAGPPAVAVVGLSCVRAGPFATVKVTAFEVTVLDRTVMETEAASAIRSADTEAVN